MMVQTRSSVFKILLVTVVLIGRVFSDCTCAGTGRRTFNNGAAENLLYCSFYTDAYGGYYHYYDYAYPSYTATCDGFCNNARSDIAYFAGFNYYIGNNSSGYGGFTAVTSCTSCCTYCCIVNRTFIGIYRSDGD